MLIVALNGMSRFHLDEIYTAAVQWLRKDGVTTLRDPREGGLTDLLEEIGAVVEANQVRFGNDDHSRYVEREIDNHHHLLWSLNGLILGWIREYSGPQYWELRRVLGAAIGRFGTYHLDKLRAVLDGLAHDDDGGVVATAGYSLEAVCRRGPRFQSFSLELVESWAKSGDPWLMWAAGASIWRIYDGLLEMPRLYGRRVEKHNVEEARRRVWEMLTGLAERFDNFDDEAKHVVVAAILATEDRNIQLAELRRRTQQELDRLAEKTARAVLHAIRRMALSDAEGVVVLISDWLGKEEGSNLRELGKLAVYQLFYENGTSDMRPLVERHAPLLGLVRLALSTDETTVDAMLTAVGIWLRDPDWEKRVLAAMLPVANQASRSETQQLRSGLMRNWVEHDEVPIRRLAQILISRLSLMNGLAADLPGESHGLLMIDASREGRLSRSSARLGLLLQAYLGAALDLSVASLGGSWILSNPGNYPLHSELQSNYSRARLLVAGLECQQTREPVLVLATTWGPIADIGDIAESAWCNCTLIADFGRGTEWPSGLAVQSFDWSSIENDPHEIDLWVRSHLASVLALRKPTAWVETLGRWYPEVNLGDLDAVIRAVESGAIRLDDVDAARLPDDAARVLLAGVLYIAAVDLSCCTEHIQRWLNSDGPVKRLAMAGSRLLYRVYGLSDPLPPVTRLPILLALAPHMAATDGIAAVETILEAVRRSVPQRDCRERLLSPANEPMPELLRMVDALPIATHEELRQEVIKWATSLSDADEEMQKWMEHLAEHLVSRLDAAHQQAIPELTDGHMYGWIVVDTAGNVETVRRRLQLSSALLKRLHSTTWDIIAPVLCRLGDGSSLTAESEMARIEAPPQRPRLLGPLLERVHPLRTAFVVLLTDEDPLDAEDWLDTEWGPRIVICAQRVSAPGGQHLARIACHRDVREAESCVLHELRLRIGV